MRDYIEREIVWGLLTGILVIKTMAHVVWSTTTPELESHKTERDYTGAVGYGLGLAG